MLDHKHEIIKRTIRRVGIRERTPKNRGLERTDDLRETIPHRQRTLREYRYTNRTLILEFRDRENDKPSVTLSTDNVRRIAAGIENSSLRNLDRKRNITIRTGERRRNTNRRRPRIMSRIHRLSRNRDVTVDRIRYDTRTADRRLDTARENDRSIIAQINTR